MSNSITVKLNVSTYPISDELKVLEFGKECEVAVVLIQTNLRTLDHSASYQVDITLQTVIPFNSFELAQTYMKSLNAKKQMCLLLPIKDGKIVLEE